MLGRTHLAFGVLAGLIFLPFYHHNLILYFVLVLVGALLPDIDHDGSKINKILPVTKYLGRLFKHRGFFHSVFPPLIIFAAFSPIDEPSIPFAIRKLKSFIINSFVENEICTLLSV